MPRRYRSRIDKLRLVVEHHQHAKVDGLRIDAQTANVMVQVHDALKDEYYRKRFNTMPMLKCVNLCWTVFSKAGRAA